MAEINEEFDFQIYETDGYKYHLTVHGNKMKLDYEAQLDLNQLTNGKSQLVKIDLTEGRAYL